MPVTYDPLIDRGDTRTLTASVAANDLPVDPDTLTLTIRTPAAVETTLTYGLDAAIVRDSEGEYHYDLTFPTAGSWTYEWQSTNPAQVQGDTLEVQPSPLDETPAVIDPVALDAFRLELGDLDEDHYLYTDAQVGYWLGKHPTSLLLSVADACDALARRFAPQFDFDTTSEKSFKLSQKSKAYRDLATELRARAKLEASGGIGVIVTTRADGYADDLNTRESMGLVGVNGRTRRGYYDTDLPPS